MQTTYDGSHSIIFCRPEAFVDDDSFPLGGPADFYGGYHSWYSLRLVPASRPFVNPPQQKTSTLEIPGANGIIDLSNVPLGFATFQNRTGSWEFHIAHDVNNMTWEEAYQDLLFKLHGKQMAVILTDDPSYFYTGRIYINAYKSDKMNSTITINYDLYPYKRMIWTTLGDWLWDPFDFYHGTIPITQGIFKDIVVDSSLLPDSSNWDLNSEGSFNHQYTPNEIGVEPVTPTFEVEPSVGTMKEFRIAVDRKPGGNVKYFNIPHGISKNPQVMFAAPDPFSKVPFIVAGKGTVSIRLRIGRL